MSKHLIIENHLQKIPGSSSKVKAYLFCLIYKTASRMGSHRTIRSLSKKQAPSFQLNVKVRVLCATQILKLRTCVYCAETTITLSWLGGQEKTTALSLGLGSSLLFDPRFSFF